MLSFAVAKVKLYKAKRQPTEWKKLFANRATDKESISRSDKDLEEINHNKPMSQLINGKAQKEAFFTG